METEKINKKLADLKNHFNFPLNYLFEHFGSVKNEIDLSAENFMVNATDVEAINAKRIEFTSQIEAFHKECVKRCPNDTLTDKVLSKYIFNEIDLIEIMLLDLGEDNSDLFNDSTMEDEIISMLTSDTVDCLNQSVNVIKQRNLDEKLKEVEVKIDGLEEILNRFLFGNQNWIFFNRSERDKYLNEEFLNLNMYCNNLPIREFVRNNNKPDQICYCNKCQIHTRNQGINAYPVELYGHYFNVYAGDDYDEMYMDYEYDYDNYIDMYYEQDYEDEEEEEENEDEEENTDEEDADEDDESQNNQNNNEIILVEEKKPEDLFFGVLIHFNHYIPNNKAIIEQIEKLAKNELGGSLTNSSLSVFYFAKELMSKARELKTMLKSQIVEVNLNKRLNALNITVKNLIAIGNNLFDDYEGLTEFQLGGKCENLLIESKLFSRCAHLRSIDFSYCSLKSIDLNLFVELPRLMTLNLSNNSIANIEAVFGEKCVHLTFLNLENNKLTSLKSKYFRKLPKLNRINLKSNLIESFEDNCFYDCHQLNQLDLSSNNLKSMKFLSKIPNNQNQLTSLNVSSNKIQYIEKGELNGLINLRVLDLSDNEISSIPDNLFFKLSDLNTLDLSKNKLKCVKSDYFSINNSQLVRLDLSFNQIASYEKNSFCYLMGFKTKEPTTYMIRITDTNSSKIEKIILYGNPCTNVHHTDNDRKRTCFLRFLPKDSKYFNEIK